MDNRIFDIKYLRVKVIVRLCENSVLPVRKTSAIRGGLGDAMLDLKCEFSRHCENCEKLKTCDARNFMYSNIENVPVEMKTNLSVGYVMECENYEERFSAGEYLKFYIILFGENIKRIGLCKEAIELFGRRGIGVRKAKFEMVSFNDDLTGQDLSDIDDSNLNPSSVRKYVSDRLRDIKKTGTYLVNFKTAVTLKEKGTYLRELGATALFNSLARRIYMLDMYEGIDVDRVEEFENYPVIVEQAMIPVSIPRFSEAKQQKMILKGIKGKAVLTNLTEEQLELLLAGELVHVGKNTSFGFGRYTVKDNNI